VAFDAFASEEVPTHGTNVQHHGDTSLLENRYKKTTQQKYKRHEVVLHLQKV